MTAPSSQRRPKFFVVIGERVDPLLVEQTLVYTRTAAKALRTLERWKLERGYCIGGFTCTHKALLHPGTRESTRFCQKHADANNSGVRLYKAQDFTSTYGELRKRQLEEERELERLAVAAEKDKKKGAAKRRRKSPSHRRAA